MKKTIASVASAGFILRKHFPHRCKLSILDKSRGHITVIPANWGWASYAAPGAFIAYDLRDCDGTCFIEAIELCALPVYKNAAAMGFLHHVLELCFVSLPIQAGNGEVFALVSAIISELDMLALDNVQQKIALAKLLFACGQYPHSIDQIGMTCVLHHSYEQLKKTVLNVDQVRELELFIYHCIGQHPAKKWLKTVNFLVWDEKR